MRTNNIDKKREAVKTKKFILALMICAALLAAAFPTGAYAQSGVVSNRINQVKKDFPNKSKFNIGIDLVSNITGNSSYRGATYSGCDGLVAYTTMKVFHNPFYRPDINNYKKIGKSVKGSNKSSLKALFKKSKKGDVIFVHDKNGAEFHAAIFLSSNSKGVRVYEANSRGKNKVWYNYQWKWKDLKTWWKGKAYISIYRSNNYSQVDKGKAAAYYKVGEEFTVDGITYKVTKTGMRNARVKVVSKENPNKKVPKAVGINPVQASRLWKIINKNSWSNSLLYDLVDGIEYRTYGKNKKWFYDEQYYQVVN